MDETLAQAAAAFGKALAESDAMREYAASLEAASADPESLRQKGELDEIYDSLTQRQSMGEVVARGEIEAYYDLEQQVAANPLLSRRDNSLERVKDYFSEAHTLLSDQLGVSFVDLAKS